MIAFGLADVVNTQAIGGSGECTAATDGLHEATSHRLELLAEGIGSGGAARAARTEHAPRVHRNVDGLGFCRDDRAGATAMCVDARNRRRAPFSSSHSRAGGAPESR